MGSPPARSGDLVEQCDINLGIMGRRLHRRMAQNGPNEGVRPLAAAYGSQQNAEHMCAMGRAVNMGAKPAPRAAIAVTAFG